MEFSATTSKELSDQDLDQIVELFYLCFNKKISAENLKYKYTTPHFGFSYIGLMKDEDNIIRGAFAIQPFNFSVQNTVKVFGSVVDVMIHEDYRSDLLAFSSMYKKVLAQIRDVISFLYAVPNQNSYLYFLKLLRWSPIGKLNYYLMPLNINKFITLPSVINYALNKILILSLNVFPTFRNTQEHKTIVKVSDASYQAYRFNDQNQYQEITANNSLIAWYRLFDEDQKNIAYLIDLINITQQSIAKAIRKILSTEQSSVDALMYIGNLSFTTGRLIKVPEKYEPRTLQLIGYKVDNDLDNDLVFDLNNWQFNLADIDVR